MKTAGMMNAVCSTFKGIFNSWFWEARNSSKRSLDDAAAEQSESKIRRISAEKEENWRKGPLSSSQDIRIDQLQAGMSSPPQGNCVMNTWEHNGWDSGSHTPCATMNHQRMQLKTHSCSQQNLKPQCSSYQQRVKGKEVVNVSEFPPHHISRHQRNHRLPFKVLDPPTQTMLSSAPVMALSCKPSSVQMSKDISPSDDDDDVQVIESSLKARQPAIEAVGTVRSRSNSCRLVNGVSPGRTHLRSHSSVLSVSSSASSRHRNTLSHEKQLEDRDRYHKLINAVTRLSPPRIGPRWSYSVPDTGIPNPSPKEKNVPRSRSTCTNSPEVSNLSLLDTKSTMLALNAQAHRKSCNGIASELPMCSNEKSSTRINVQVNRTHEQEPKTSGRHQPQEDDCFVVAVRQAPSLPRSTQLDMLADIKRKYEERAKLLSSEAGETVDISSKRGSLTEAQKMAKKWQELGEIDKKLKHYLNICEEIPKEEVEEIPILPELTPEMEKDIDVAFRQPDDKVLVFAYSITIKGRDIRTLKGLNWLNDEVINFYMNLLIERGKSDKYPSVYACNTFFYPKLISSGHAALKRWTRKVDIFAHDFVVVPVHLGMHWCMAIVDMQKKVIQYYDSMNGKNRQCLDALFRYLQDESLDKKKRPFDTTGWKTEFPEDIPQQNNGSDCGMFSCMYAEYVCRRASITFTQDDMPYFRRKMVYEILKAKLLC